MNKKIVSYIGFSIKKGSIKLGLDEIIKAKFKVKLIIYSNSLGESTLKKVKSYAEERNLNCIDLTEELVEVFQGKEVKVLGITDNSLKNAIIKEYSQN